MIERIFLRLSEKWALGHDNNQWIVCQWRGEKVGWCAASFVGQNKLVLAHVLAEKGVEVTEGARSALDHLPETFHEWRTGLDVKEAPKLYSHPH